MKPKPDLKQCAVLIGLDWADEKHDVALRVPGSPTLQLGTFAHTPEAIAAWVAALRQRFGQGPIALCLEQSRGALLNALSAHENLLLYPINPQMLAKFRAALHPSGKKDDPIDATLLLQLLEHFGDQLTPWQPDDATTRQLALLVEARRGFVDQCTGLANQLQAVLKSYFPQALALVGEDLTTRMATDFLKRWSTLAAVQAAKPSVLRAFYYGHNSRSEDLITQRLAVVKNAVALTSDPAIVGAQSLAAGSLAGALAALRPVLARYDEAIARLFAAHPDAPIFSSLDGAGAVLAPRLLVAFGTDRDRFADADAMPRYSGTAPVTVKSGKQKWVHRRWARPVFVHQSFIEFAGCSVRCSGWAKRCYDGLIQKGQGHWAALRVLAVKWQRVIWRCWRDRTPYDEATYVKSLQKRGLKLYADLAVEGAQTHGE
ncbi:MAG: IS110 family transposase [Anaerolineales bacterium]|nr:IS110 family transposase [Anaerolineales bacterium]